MKKNQTQIFDRTDLEVLTDALDLYGNTVQNVIARGKGDRKALAVKLGRARFLAKSFLSWDADIISVTAWTREPEPAPTEKIGGPA